MCLYVRSLKLKEGRKIQAILRRGKNRTAIRRAQVILMSAQESRVKEIALQTLLHPEYVRRLIRRFDIEGLRLFEERPGRGRPGEFSDEIKAEIAEIAQCPPLLLRQPYSRWSLDKLQVYLIKTKVVSKISIETLRTILKEQRVSHQRTKTWKESNDPDFEGKKKRLTRLYRHRPKGSRVICFDEFGPFELRPQYGMHWGQRRHPQRLPATYTRYHGVRHLLAFFDVDRDQFWGYFFQRKRWQETLRAFKRLRKRYPRRIRIYLILDNFSPHKRPEIRRWARENNVCLVWTPTNASWLNRIECQFTEIRKFSIDNTFYNTHRQLQRAVRRFIRYRNKRQRNKTKKKIQP